ncbi:MAG: diguanylate cyclase [Hyphomicrobiaceae bacterium]|nr:MAG: diguanylate cyclase [Hyphomicrobiaceae bacterium]
MRITALSRIAGAAIAAGIMVIVGTGWLAMRELSVNGPIYQRIAAGKDLIANVVPPPAYIIEAFLEATTIIKEPWTYEPGRKRLAKLRKEYDERHEFWSRQALAPALRSQFLKAAHEPAKYFWEIVDDSFLPAIQAGNSEAASDAYLQMVEAYRAHRSAIDEVITLAKRSNAGLEHLATEREHTILATMAILTALVVAFVVACILGTISWVVGPIVRMQEAMRRLAGGDLKVSIPSLHRRDEIGDMAGAVQVFHTSAVERSTMNREARLLSQLNEWLQSCKSLEELYRMVGEFLSKLLPGCAGHLYIYANSRDILESATAWNGAHSAPAIHPDDCWGLRRGRTYTFGENEIDFPCAHVETATSDYCCIPILAHGDTIGLLHLEFGRGHGANASHPCTDAISEQRRLGLVCAEHISLAIANVKLRDQLRDQSIRDALTGLYNRRYLLETCRREFSRAARSGQSVSLFSIDVDHFKKYNDNHGHDAGDTVLRAVGDCLKSSFRDEDVPCRFGGEEFVVVLPGAGADAAARKAEELRSKVESLVVRYVDGNLPRITISIGVAVFPHCGDNPQAVLKAADEALYRAKEEGRNRVVLSPGINAPQTMQRMLATSFAAPAGGQHRSDDAGARAA